MNSSAPPKWTPVSYTHLDVYKRQGHGFGLGIVQRLLDAAGGRLELEQHAGTIRARVLA